MPSASQLLSEYDEDEGYSRPPQKMAPATKRKAKAATSASADLPAAHEKLHAVSLLRGGLRLEDLCERHKLSSRKHPDHNLVQLSYDQIHSDLAHPLTRECRGLILEKGSWRVVALPFTKFFNAGEANASEFDWSTAKVYEKVDGSLMNLYYYGGSWHVASMKQPAADGGVPFMQGTSFADAFWQVWKRMGYKMPARTDVCYVFELTLPEHSIVVRHAEPGLTLLGARDLNTLIEMSCEEVAEANGWQPARRFDELVADGQAPTLETVMAAAKKLDPVRQEGFVVVDSAWRRLKIKCPSYVALHHLQGNAGNMKALSLSSAKEQTPEKVRRRVRCLIEVALLNEGSEFLTYYPHLALDYKKVIGRLKALPENVREGVLLEGSGVDGGGRRASNRSKVMDAIVETLEERDEAKAVSVIVRAARAAVAAQGKGGLAEEEPRVVRPQVGPPASAAEEGEESEGEAEEMPRGRNPFAALSID